MFTAWIPHSRTSRTRWEDGCSADSLNGALLVAPDQPIGPLHRSAAGRRLGWRAPSSGGQRFDSMSQAGLPRSGRTGTATQSSLCPRSNWLLIRTVAHARFERIAAEGRLLVRTQPIEAAAILKDALAMWRGRALAEFQYEEFAIGEANRLEELRLTVIGDRIGADLARGAHREVVDELESLTREYPTREELRAIRARFDRSGSNRCPGV